MHLRTHHPNMSKADVWSFAQEQEAAIGYDATLTYRPTLPIRSTRTSTKFTTILEESLLNAQPEPHQLLPEISMPMLDSTYISEFKYFS